LGIVRIPNHRDAPLHVIIVRSRNVRTHSQRPGAHEQVMNRDVLYLQSNGEDAGMFYVFLYAADIYC
jgi:hypothetical protein